MKELKVRLGKESYPICIGQGILAEVGKRLADRKIATRYAIITDEKVAGLYGDALKRSLSQAQIETELFSIAQGEVSKNLETVAALASKMASHGFDRSSGIIAFGGGVPGDIAGFLASSYMRGIPFVQVPTTLLAQVDSSVGGKTGVDIPEGKNLVGAFYQPKAVFIDPQVLVTLDNQELLGGLAEVIKYGVIWDRQFFSFLLQNRPKILSLEVGKIEELIHRCCEIKAEVVSLDEREGGLRRILNYGHTIGHAVEGASCYTIIHGLAVAIGMVAAARLAHLAGLLSKQVQDEIHQLIREYGLPTEVPEELDREQIKRYLLTDKKNIDGKTHFILPTRIGKVEISNQIRTAQVDQVLG